MSFSLLQSYDSDSSEEDQTATEHQAISQPSLTSAATKPSSGKGKGAKDKNQRRENNSRQQDQKSTSDIPPDLARELKAAGRDSSTIEILEFDPTPIANQPHPSSHIPQHALRNNAMRLARHITKESVSTIARRKHQITALAAEAVALQVAHDTLPGTARLGSRKNGKFK